MPSVEVREVTKRFRKLVALDKISFRVEDREFFTLVGPTNAGKTTTLRVIAGLEKPNRGEVFLDDASQADVPPNKRDVALMFQNLALYPHRNGFDNIAVPLRVQKVPGQEIKKRVGEVAGFLKIGHLLDRLPGTYSGGERQRLAFARTMIRDPRLYMLDEPLANLDALIRLQMRMELKRIHQELGKTLVYVTHDQVEAMTMSDRIAVLNKGRIQQIDPPDGIYMNPVNRFVAGFFGSPPMNFIEAGMETAEGRVWLGWGDSRVDGTNLAARLKGAGERRKVILGVRPEDISIDQGEGSGTGLKGKVVSLEQLGPKTILDVNLSGTTLRVNLPTTFDYRVRDQVAISMNVDRGHLFDPESGLNQTKLEGTPA